MRDDEALLGVSVLEEVAVAAADEFATLHVEDVEPLRIEEAHHHSRTISTLMRGPRMWGFPASTAGSETMRSNIERESWVR